MHALRIFLLLVTIFHSGILIAQDTKKSEQVYNQENNILYRSEEQLDEYSRERCKLDIYYPVDKKDFPTVIWFHGGGLTGGNKSIPAELKSEGIAVVAVNYRLSPKVKSPAYIEDAAAAVAWTFKNISKYKGSAKRIFVSGHSAGGYLASMISLDKRWLAKHDLDADSIAGLVPLSGQSNTHFTIKVEAGIAKEQPMIDELAPVFHVRKDAPPILIISGDRELEMVGRYEETAYFWRMLKVVGHPDAKLMELDGFNHGGMTKPGLSLLLNFIKDHSPDISK
jgi:acetyl esterase/lipase